jgi:alkanesulfonate monooxygenase SsuD/methylene tetrahydromethanopterin reductase-like flavin-dependent oxidoreductase (luciferase family)
VEFGIFDHLDATGQPLDAYYADRLELISRYDELGFRSYHVAEHHSTPLGMAPSPNLFLSAIAGRTTRLRFGPMVFALPLYHPLRLVEEICMLDQMSRGRLEIGFGRGASAIEASYFGNDHSDAEAIYREYLDLIMSGMTEGRLHGKGEYYEFDDVPLMVGPYQKPHPPLWYGVHSTDSAARAARLGSNIVSLDTAQETQTFAERYREVWREDQGQASEDLQNDARATPLIGLALFVFIADTDEAALAAARRAYRVWFKSFNYLFARHNTAPPKHQRPPQWDEMAAQGRAIAGGPATVRRKLQALLDTSTANYLVGQFAFGDLTLVESTQSIELFAEHVMPALA